MKIFHDLNEWLSFRKNLSAKHTIGFAPTMGNLHAGHSSLFLASHQKNNYTVSSLFVNPTQFNQATDYAHYPRTLDADLELMAKSGVDFCIIPEEQNIYPDSYNYRIQEQELSQLMEGAHRPGHFNGVLTVVMKLFNLIRPQRAYFGEKDYQQYLLIKNLVNAFFMDIELLACPTVREPSGLAYSSRNNRLSSEQKALAEMFAQVFQQKEKTLQQIHQELSTAHIMVDYVEEHGNRRYAAVVIGEIRLIDNYCL